MLVKTLRGNLLAFSDRHGSDDSSGRTPAGPFGQKGKGCLVPAGQGFDAAIPPIAHPAVHPQASRFGDHGPAVADPLDATRDGEVA